jgi:gluconolactonase
MQAIATHEPVLVAATDAHEGPVYVPDEDALYFTTVRRDRVAIKRLALADGSLSVLRADANMANGMALGRDGRLVVCEQGTLAEPARISLVDRATGAVEPLLEAVGCRPLNSPNDVVVCRDGTVWFTDPSYGFLQGFRPAPELPDAVYRYDRTSAEAVAVCDTLDKPNGLAFSPDERVLYVGDSGAVHGPGDYDPGRPRRVLAFDVVADGLAGERVFADAIPGFPDGIKTDGDGNVYVSSANGVLVFTPAGRLAAEIHLPGAVNFALGGTDQDVLYVTADTAVWAASPAQKGARA